MDFLLVYLLEVSVCLGVTLLIYRVILSELTFFAVNRAVLLLLLASSFTIPLLSFQVFGIGGADVVREMTLPAFQVGEQETLTSDQVPLWSRLAVGIYLLGAILMAARLVFGFILSQRLIGKAQKIRHGSHLIALHPEFVPASFFRYILMPSFDPEDDAQKQIILHESMHVAYRHSWDLLLVNMVKVVFWFNPLIYLFERSLREVHEYQADQGVTSYFSPKEYATLLLRLITAKHGWQFMNNFNQFQTKKRIIMMAKGKSSSVQKLRILALFPVFGMLLFIFSCEKEELLPSVVELEKEFPAILEVPLTDDPAPDVPKEEVQKVNPLLIIEDADEIFDIVEQQPSPEGGMSGWNTYLARNLRYPLVARQRGVEGTVIIVFEIHTDGSIHNVEVLRGIGGGADEEAVRVVSNAPRWEPGRQRGRAVKTRMRLPIRFKLEKGITPPEKTSISEVPVTSKGLTDAVSVIGYLSNQ
ncbi:TonB family protein [Algoriphagus aquatilis]|uniref:TonB family protein n=1 Tax=Algoriphagus aquatilis TaxID=490186 RepID=A0ABW0C1L5_9BACT